MNQRKGKRKNITNISKKNKKIINSNKESKIIKNNEVIGPFNKIDKNHSNNLKPKNLPSSENNINIQEISNNYSDKKDSNLIQQNKSSYYSLNRDKKYLEKKSYLDFKIVKTEMLNFNYFSKNNYKYKIGKLYITFFYYDINDKTKKYIIKLNNENNIIKKQKYIQLKIVKSEKLNFNYPTKNSYDYNKYKIGKLYITFFYYDINDKTKRPLKNLNNNIKIIDNINKIINEENLINENNINNQTIFINDIYYNKKEGLENFGCTCYFNSFIQIIIHVPGLIERLMDYKNNFPKDSLLYCLLNVAEIYSNKNIRELRRRFIIKNSDYKYYKQEDSQEFGSEFLKLLNDELTELDYFIGLWNIEDEFNIKNKKVKQKLDKLNDLINNQNCDLKYQTVINYYFYYYESEVIICNNKILNYNYYGDVDNQLSFNTNNYRKSLNLTDMLENKYLYGNNKLIKLPIIFNITLLRAVIDMPLIKTEVLINLDIDLKDFLDKDFGDYSLPTEYTLYALNVCVGSSKRAGHYYSYILINKEWIKFDDSIVRKVSINSIKEDLPYIYGIYYINKAYLNSLKEQ